MQDQPPLIQKCEKYVIQRLEAHANTCSHSEFLALGTALVQDTFRDTTYTLSQCQAILERFIGLLIEIAERGTEATSLLRRIADCNEPKHLLSYNSIGNHFDLDNSLFGDIVNFLERDDVSLQQHFKIRSAVRRQLTKFIWTENDFKALSIVRIGCEGDEHFNSLRILRDFALSGCAEYLYKNNKITLTKGDK
jgi:ribosomal protein L19